MGFKTQHAHSDFSLLPSPRMFTESQHCCSIKNIYRQQCKQNIRSQQLHFLRKSDQKMGYWSSKSSGKPSASKQFCSMGCSSCFIWFEFKCTVDGNSLKHTNILSLYINVLNLKIYSVGREEEQIGRKSLFNQISQLFYIHTFNGF